MKTLIKSALLLLLVTALIGCGSDVSSFDLVQRDGLFYKKFSEVPFTGKVTGLDKGLIKNGKREGAWVLYWENGQLMSKGNWKKGKKDGLWVYYFEAGRFNASWSGTFKNGVKISD